MEFFTRAWRLEIRDEASLYLLAVTENIQFINKPMYDSSFGRLSCLICFETIFERTGSRWTSLLPSKSCRSLNDAILGTFELDSGLPLPQDQVPARPCRR